MGHESTIKGLLEEIQIRKAELASELSDLEATERVLRKRVAVDAPRADVTVAAVQKTQPQVVVSRQPLPDGTPTRYQQCEDVLKDVGHPLRTPEIAKRIESKGLANNVENLKTQIFTAMKRRGDVFTKTPEGWGLVAWKKRSSATD